MNLSPWDFRLWHFSGLLTHRLQSLLFGGYNHRDKFAYDDAYILSLPGFVWTKVPQTTAGARRYHSCVSVGKRQVLVIGGTRDGWGDPDPAPQGLLLFDMTNWEWKDSYDARAPAYKRAAEIQDWYREKYGFPLACHVG